jgi:hypothetical protein
MAQTGYTPIKLYASSTASAVPLAGNLDNTNGAELAINITDGRLYYKDNGGTVRVIAGTGGTGVVAGSNTQIQFNNSGVFGASSNLTWNGSTLAVTGTTAVTGALTATADSTFSSTGALLISKGTSGQQPGSPVTGMLRYNTTTNQFEGYSGSSPAWNPVGGATLSNDTSTATNLYPLFANATTGSATTVYTSNAKLLYKPSTGELQATVLDATNGIFVNSQTIAADYTIASTDNGGSFGPITVNSGITVTVSSGAVWTVV